MLLCDAKSRNLSKTALVNSIFFQKKKLQQLEERAIQERTIQTFYRTYLVIVKVMEMNFY